MALNKCKECGNEVSTKAKSCPKCGAALKKPGGCLRILGIVIGCSIFLGIVSSLIDPGTDTDSQSTQPANTEPSESTQSVIEPEPEPEPEPKETVPAIGTYERLIYEITQTLGSCNRDVRRIHDINVNGDFVLVKFSINDNLANSWIKFGAKADIIDILKAVSKSQYPYSIIDVNGTFALTDKYGNSEESKVIQATYRRSTVERINWSGFDLENVYEVGEDIWLHPAFRD
ncbi:MAG: zinc-ribbon domain-containing protein [Actinobacteria bacterium]|nr:zinc-ribbon domain-containing protein [Actinomycetota bacterium]